MGIKLISATLSTAIVTSALCCFPVQAAAAEEITMPQTNINTVYPVTVRIDQQAGIAIAEERAAEEAAAAAAAAAAQAAAEEAARKAAEEAEQQAAAQRAAQQSKEQKKASSSSSSKSAPKTTTSTTRSSNSSVGQTVVNAAKSLIGTPYGATVNGITIDCSGLVCYAYSQAGISLPHSSSQQAKYCNDRGYAISANQLQPGDLVFWTYPWGSGFMNIGHVGIYAGNGQVIDASPNGVVQRSLYDQNCICFYARPY